MSLNLWYIQLVREYILQAGLQQAFINLLMLSPLYYKSGMLIMLATLWDVININSVIGLPVKIHGTANYNHLTKQIVLTVGHPLDSW